MPGILVSQVCKVTELYNDNLQLSCSLETAIISAALLHFNGKEKEPYRKGSYVYVIICLCIS